MKFSVLVTFNYIQINYTKHTFDRINECLTIIALYVQGKLTRFLGSNHYTRIFIMEYRLKMQHKLSYDKANVHSYNTGKFTKEILSQHVLVII